jgi:DAACS family dicarboxylate/amino acid:cation (Na+ or H+) symporter
MLIGLVVGAGVGLLAHAVVPRASGSVREVVPAGDGKARTVWISTGPDLLALAAPAETVAVNDVEVTVTERAADAFAVTLAPTTLARLKAGSEVVVEAGPWRGRVGFVRDNVAYPVGKLFLRLIFMVVLPLVVSSLMLGVLELGDVKALGRIGLRTLGYTVVVSSLSVVIGIGLVNLVRPGAWVSASTRDRLVADYGDQSQRALDNARAAKPWTDSLLSLIPENPLAAAVDALKGEMLAVMVFALLFGIALTRVRDAETEALVGVLRGLQRASMQVIAWAMELAPFGVAALLFTLTSRTGVGVISSLGAYMAVVIVALLVHGLGVYSVILALAARVSPAEWFRRCREVILTSFSTSSSNATLPTSLRTSAEKLGVPEKIGNFVLTVGATGNQNGTALFEGVTVLFLAQVFGVDLSIPQQLTVVGMSILAGVGTAGVPGGSLPLIVIVMQTVGVPAEGIAIILGVDRILDMCRTVVNVVGDLVCATYVAAAEGELAFDAPGA